MTAFYKKTVSQLPLSLMEAFSCVTAFLSVYVLKCWIYPQWTPPYQGKHTAKDSLWYWLYRNFLNKQMWLMHQSLRKENFIQCLLAARSKPSIIIILLIPSYSSALPGCLRRRLLLKVHPQCGQVLHCQSVSYITKETSAELLINPGIGQPCQHLLSLLCCHDGSNLYQNKR